MTGNSMDCVSGGNLPWPKQKSENQKVESHKNVFCGEQWVVKKFMRRNGF